MINASLNGVARTLVLTLRARAEEQTRDAPLVEDPWSAEWYRHLPTYDDYDSWYNLAFQVATIIRTRLMDDAAAAFIESHDRPLVVELGAGFSTRYYRLGEGKTRWIELDLEEAIVVRRKLDVEVRDHWFLPADMTQADWMDKLPESESDNTLFIAEGVLMFADPEGIAVMMDALRERYAGAAFLFDVVNPGYIMSTEEDFSELEAPMQWGVNENELAEYGLDVQHTEYMLLAYPERWDEIGVDNGKRTKDRSGYVVKALLV